MVSVASISSSAMLVLALCAQAMPVAPEKELYQGLHLPPGLRHSVAHMPAHRRRDIPYGGIISFGNMPLSVVGPAAPQTQPCPDELRQKNGGPHRPLLGLVDLDLDLHV
ncbi:hypothetical protein GGI07_005744 [Coemansia sp. Benny D115]|nr:hypothetical protein GGI07_005744 [Coemansia sp. Benny D115]